MVKSASKVDLRIDDCWRFVPVLCVKVAPNRLTSSSKENRRRSGWNLVAGVAQQGKANPVLWQPNFPLDW
jgi:hypothetical protein